MSDLFDLTSKAAIVVGGAGLIGQSLSTALAEHGASVVVADRDTDAGAEISAADPGIQFRETDVTDVADVEDLMSEVLEEYGSLDVLVNTAYPRTDSYGKPYVELAYQDWRENVDVHMNSYFLSSHRASLLMRDQPDGGSIVNVASIYGLQAPDFSVYEGTDMQSPASYAAIKGGIINMTRYIASRLGEDGVRANTLSPGGVFADQPSSFVEKYERRTPLGRMARPDDFEGPVVFLASDASRYVTGQNLVVDGGWSIC